MDKTKERIIKMINMIDNEKYISYIYTLVKTLLETKD